MPTVVADAPREGVTAYDASMPAVRSRMRLTVLGCSTALPHPDAPSAGFLVEWDETAILLDVGQGVADRLGRLADARELAGVVIGHMHADHFLELAGLRYLFPWAGGGSSLLPVHLPPGATPNTKTHTQKPTPTKKKKKHPPTRRNKKKHPPQHTKRI
jgi:ribonuclease BN (tRNA processing enzyme)